MMFEMKLERCFIDSTLEFLVIYYLIHDVPFFHFRTNELFCENKGWSLFRVADRGGGAGSGGWGRLAHLSYFSSLATASPSLRKIL